MSASALRAALGDTNKAIRNGVQYFLCNTNRWFDAQTGELDTELEEQMFKRDFAAAWERFNFYSHMDRVKKDDVIFMYANGKGFVRVGRANGIVDKLKWGQRGRIRNFSDELKRREWRVSVEWLARVDEDDALSWSSQTLFRNKTFFDITPPEHNELRAALSKYFR